MAEYCQQHHLAIAEVEEKGLLRTSRDEDATRPYSERIIYENQRLGDLSRVLTDTKVSMPEQRAGFRKRQITAKNFSCIKCIHRICTALTRADAADVHLEVAA